MNISNSQGVYSVCVFNDSTILVGGQITIGIYRFDFNETQFWFHSKVDSMAEDSVSGITLNPHNKSEGFISHISQFRFLHITFNGTHVKRSGNFFKLKTSSQSRDINFNSEGNKLLASLDDGTISLLSLCPVQDCASCAKILQC